MSISKTITRALPVVASAATLMSCSVTNLQSEDGTILAGADDQNIWTVIKAESAMYSPFMDVGNKQDSLDMSRSSTIVFVDLIYSWLTVKAQDLTLQSGDKILEVNQPVYKEYGEAKVGDQGVVVYVRWNSAQNNIFSSNKKLHPRFLTKKAILVMKNQQQ